MTTSIKSDNLKSTRDGFGEGLLALGQKNKDVVVLSADLAESTRAVKFREKYPDRYIEVGVAEQNLIGIAAGLAQEGKIPFCASFAAFSPARNWDQIRLSVCLNNVNVKICSTHAGLTTGADGASHQSLEDIALMRVLPNMTVISPCDAIQAKKAAVAAADYPHPCYLRLSRYLSPAITDEKDSFTVGKADILRPGKNLTIFAHGVEVWPSLAAAKQLANKISIEVINIHTIKPLDEKVILQSVQKTKQAVVVEEAEQAGGLFGAVAELLAERRPTAIIPVTVCDSFGQSGSADQLLNKYHLVTGDIIKAVEKLI